MQTGCRQFCWDDFGEILHVTELLDKTRAIRAGEELDLARLEPYLRSHLPDAAGPLVVEQFPAGHSNLTYSVRIGPLDMVLRRPPFGSKVKSAHDMGANIGSYRNCTRRSRPPRSRFCIAMTIQFSARHSI